ncbi:HK97 gp10 family phage protein [Priestia megaterium]|uniref:HK97 gp10 family phage protein n=1 Tax=Priestia megaterium TaxID=1404 RepID=UPI003F7DB218
MPKVNITVQNNSKQAIRMMKDAQEDRLLEAITEWHAGIVEDMLVGERSGRTYRIPGSTRTYRASRPGEAPATVTGRLRSSYRFRVTETGGNKVGEVGSPLDYALYLEKGTSRMAPRPHVLPAYYKRESSIKAALTREWFK